MIPGPWTVRHLVYEGRDLFEDWMAGLKDLQGKAEIAKRLGRLASGNLGDCRFIGGAVWELKIDHGPGYRVYYGVAGSRMVLLILGGAKGSQRRDAERAMRLWSAYRRKA